MKPVYKAGIGIGLMSIFWVFFVMFLQGPIAPKPVAPSIPSMPAGIITISQQEPLVDIVQDDAIVESEKRPVWAEVRVGEYIYTIKVAKLCYHGLLPDEVCD